MAEFSSLHLEIWTIYSESKIRDVEILEKWPGIYTQI